MRAIRGSARAHAAHRRRRTRPRRGPRPRHRRGGHGKSRRASAARPPVLDHLDVEIAHLGRDGLGHRPDRKRSMAAGRTSVPAVTAAERKSRTGRPCGSTTPRPRVLPFASRAMANVPLEFAAEDEAVLRPGRPARVLERVDDLVRAIRAAAGPRSLERLRRDPVEDGAEDDEHEKRRQAAPQDEPPANGPDEVSVRCKGFRDGRIRARRRRPVRHRSGGTRCRGRSRCVRLRSRASSGGSERRRRRRWA